MFYRFVQENMFSLYKTVLESSFRHCYRLRTRPIRDGITLEHLEKYGYFQEGHDIGVAGMPIALAR
jgi:hypothetical protein